MYILFSDLIPSVRYQACFMFTDNHYRNKSFRQICKDNIIMYNQIVPNLQSSAKMQNVSPKYIKTIQCKIESKLKLVKRINSEIFETKQMYFDEVLEIYQEAFKDLIESTITHSSLLSKIKNAYEDALRIRDERISQFIIQDKVFGISVKKKQRDDKIKHLMVENQRLREENLKLTLELSRLRKDLGKLNDDKFSDYLSLMRERDARYTLYFENVALQLRVRELDSSSRACAVDDAYRDPVVLKIALDRCREQLSATQTELKRMKEEFAESVPRREHDALEAKLGSLSMKLQAISVDYEAHQNIHKRVLAQKKSLEDELTECKEKCSELERAGTPRPRWELCADFIGGGRERWWQLANGLSSRDMLRVLLKELGPAAESEHLEYFDGLGMDPVIPPYLRYEGRVRNLRLSRREISVIINDIWLGKLRQPRDIAMQDYVTHYFEERYQQPSIRAEWAYNLCAGAEQMLDEPQVKLFWGVLHGHLSEDIYWGHRTQWYTLKEQLYKHSKDGETITIEDFEKVTRATFPLKSEVDIRNLSDVVKKQLKLKINANEVNLDKLFHENEEGFDRVELSRELYRQRQLAQDKYIREVVGTLGGRRTNSVSVDSLKRAFAIVDPAINHIRMERYIRWAFSAQACDLSSLPPIPLRALVSRLAAGDIERIGPRYRGTRKSYK